MALVLDWRRTGRKSLRSSGSERAEEMAAEGRVITSKWMDGRSDRERDGWKQKRGGSNRRKEGKILKAWVGLSSPQPLNI